MAAVSLHAGHTQINVGAKQQQVKNIFGRRADRTDKMAQQIKVLGLKSDNLSSVSQDLHTRKE